MTPSGLEPPGLAAWLLKRMLPRGVDGQTVAGDLLEEFDARIATNGVRAARRWYRWQALTVGLSALLNPDRPRRLASQTIADFKLAWRAVAKAPAIMVAVVLTVGLAVGANTALFSVFDGLLFRPLPYKDPDRIVHLELNLSTRASMSSEVKPALTRVGTTPSLLDRAYAGPATLFDRAGAAVIDWELRAYILSPSAFDLLGVRPVLGRGFVEADRTTTPYTVLLGYDLWRTRFASDSTIVGRSIEIPMTAPEERWRVVGVMPPGFSFPEGANFWVPDYPFWPEPRLMPYARLAPGVTVESLRAELPQLTITPLREHVRPSGALALGVLLAATALMLLVAWVQVAALLFARATGRATEIGVRLALGATRGRLVRQFGLEATVLVLLALGFAALVAPALTAWIVRALPTEMTLGQQVSPDLRAFLFAAGLSGIGILLLTILPVDLIRRSSPLRLLRGGTTDLGLRAGRVRRALFVAQLALATSLVYLSGLALQSFVKVADAPLGFAVPDLYAIRLPRGDNLFSGGSRSRFDQRRTAVAETIEALRALQGVRSAAGTNSWPMQLDGLDSLPLVSDADPARDPLPARRVSIQPGYPAALGVALLAGREPTPTELLRITRDRDEFFALANHTLARHLERFGPAVGQVVGLRGSRQRIVGVMPDVILDRADRPIEPTLFLYLPPTAVTNVVMVRLEPGRTVEQVGIPSVLERLWQRPAPRPFPITDAVNLATSDYRARTLLLGLVAILTVPLTMLGVAGALAYTTKQRAREIAIELAIGADARVIRARVVRQAMVAAAAAVAMGLGVGIGIGRLMSTAFFGVRAADPITLVASVAVVMLVVWIASLVPAHRAGRFSPTTVLRES